MGDETGCPWRNLENCCLKNGLEKARASSQILYLADLYPRIWGLCLFLCHWDELRHRGQRRGFSIPWSVGRAVVFPKITTFVWGADVQLKLSRITWTFNCALRVSCSPAPLCRHNVEQQVHDSENAHLCSQAHRLCLSHCSRHMTREDCLCSLLRGSEYLGLKYFWRQRCAGLVKH